MLLLGEPHLELKNFLLLSVHTLDNIKSKMSEVSLEDSSGTLDGDFSGVAGDVDSSGDGNFFFSKNGLHYFIFSRLI